MTYENVFKEINALKREIRNWDADFYADINKNEATKALISRFNPERDVIVSKSELDLTNHLKALSGMALVVEQVAAVQKDTSIKVTDLHARVTNTKLYTKEKPLTKKQREEAELERLRQNAHNKIRMNGYKR